MIVEYIRYGIAEAHDAFEQAYATAAAVLRESTHCLGYELSRCVEDPTRYILRIEWDSAEGHLQGFRRSAEFRTFYAAIAPYVTHIEEMRHYAVTLVASRHDKPDDQR